MEWKPESSNCCCSPWVHATIVSLLDYLFWFLVRQKLNAQNSKKVTNQKQKLERGPRKCLSTLIFGKEDGKGS